MMTIPVGSHAKESRPQAKRRVIVGMCPYYTLAHHGPEGVVAGSPGAVNRSVVSPFPWSHSLSSGSASEKYLLRVRRACPKH